jgi:hypothetical protein
MPRKRQTQAANPVRAQSEARRKAIHDVCATFGSRCGESDTPARGTKDGLRQS